MKVRPVGLQAMTRGTIVGARNAELAASHGFATASGRGRAKNAESLVERDPITCFFIPGQVMSLSTFARTGAQSSPAAAGVRIDGLHQELIMPRGPEQSLIAESLIRTLIDQLSMRASTSVRSAAPVRPSHPVTR